MPILNLVINVLSRAGRRLKGGHRKKIGRQLFAVYQEMSQVVVVGHRIVDAFEDLLATYSPNSSGESNIASINPFYSPIEVKFDNINKLTDKQQQNLDRIHDSMLALERELQLLDERFYDGSLQLSDAKTRWIGVVRQRIVVRFANEATDGHKLNVETAKEIRDYLVMSRPRERLEEIERQMDRFHQMLVHNFPATDILP